MRSVLQVILMSTLVTSCGLWGKKGSDSSSSATGRASQDANAAAAALSDHEKSYLLMEAPAGLTASLTNSFVAKATAGQIEALRRAVQADGNRMVIPADPYPYMPDLAGTGGTARDSAPSSTTAVAATCPSGDSGKATHCSFFGDSSCARGKTVGSSCGEGDKGHCEAVQDNPVTVSWWCSTNYVLCTCRG